MPLWTRKVDPETGSYVIEDGRYVRIPASAGACHALCTTDGGSVPDGPQFSARLRALSTHLYPGVTQAVRTSLRDALRQYDGVLWKSSDVHVWIEDGELRYEATVTE